MPILILKPNKEFMMKVYIRFCITILCRSQSQMDVDSGIETMEVDEVEIRHDVKRRRVRQ